MFLVLLVGTWDVFFLLLLKICCLKSRWISGTAALKVECVKILSHWWVPTSTIAHVCVNNSVHVTYTGGILSSGRSHYKLVEFGSNEF